eukprot:284561_1
MASINTSSTETTSLVNTGKPTLKPFIISSVLIAFIIIGTTTFIVFEKTHFNLSLNENIDVNHFSCSDPIIDCNGHGLCLTTNECLCNDGYITYNSVDGTECNYKQQSQLVAFLLSFFIGTAGVGRFYVGDNALGAIKLCIVFVGCCCWCICIIGSYANKQDACAGIGMCIMCLTFVASSIWWIVDWILFAMNEIPDKNGVQLEPW